MTKKIAIIGAGIVGATASFYLSNQEVELTIFDDGLGQATSASAGIISPWLSQRRNKEWYFLAKEGAKFYHTLISDLSKETPTNHLYQQTGTLLYKKNETLLDKLKQLAETRKEEAPEIGDISTLSFKQASQLIPYLSSEEDAIFITGGAKIDGKQLVLSLLEIVKKSGHTFIPKRVEKISLDQSKWMILCDATVYEFDQIILAGGAWIGDLLTPLNFEVDIRPQKGQLIEIQTNLDTNNWPVMMPVGETDIIPFDDGKILVGATHENDEGFDLEPDLFLLEKLKTEAQVHLEELKAFPISATRVGTRAYTSDFSPFFGEVKNLPQLFVASGLGSSGLTTGPIIGKTLADWALDKTTLFEDYRNKPNQYIFPKK